MDKYAVKEIEQEHNGVKYKYPIGALAENVDTSAARRFTSDEEINKLKMTIDDALSDSSKNPVQNKVIKAQLDAISNALNNINIALGGKADILTTNRTVYVSPAGSDEAGDGTEAAPWRSIQCALDYAPKVTGNYEYVVMLSPGTYDGFLAAGINVKIKLIGNVTITGSTASDNNALVDVNNATVTFISDGHATMQFVRRDTTYVIYTHNSGNFNCYNVDVQVDCKGNGVGITATTNSGYTSSGQDDTKISNAKTAINIGPNSSFFSYTITGAGNTTGIRVQGGTVTCDTYSISAETQILKESGGRVYSGLQE